MCKDTPKTGNIQEKNLFSFAEPVSEKKIRVGFDAPDLSSNGGLLLVDKEACGLIDRMAQCIPDSRKQEFVDHSYQELLRQRIGQIVCGYEDANDCDKLRHDSALKLMAGRLPSGKPLGSQPTMSRLENSVSTRTLYELGRMFVREFVKSFDKAPKHVILDVDDTNANTYGAQQLSLFNDYYGEYCYMPMLMFDGVTGKMILPLLKPGRRNKSVNVFGILRRVVEFLRECWPNTIIEVRGDSHFCSHEFMDWAHGKRLVRFITGLSGNKVLLGKVDKARRRAENDYTKQGKDICRYFKFEYKAQSWKYAQRVVAKVEVNGNGTNIRFVVSSNRNNTAQWVYRRYCKRGTMELWIKDMKYLRADRMSCSSFKANQFRLFLHAAAYVILHDMKRRLFNGTGVAKFTTDSFIKSIMLSAIHVTEKKTFVHVSFVRKHRFREQLEAAFEKLAA